MEPIYKLAVDPFLPSFVPLKGWRKLLAKFGFPVRREVTFGVTNDQRVLCNPAVLEQVKQHLRARGIKYVLDRSCLTEASKEVEP